MSQVLQLIGSRNSVTLLAINKGRKRFDVAFNECKKDEKFFEKLGLRVVCYPTKQETNTIFVNVGSAPRIIVVDVKGFTAAQATKIGAYVLKRLNEQDVTNIAVHDEEIV
jgi:hypothetical protein